VQHNFYIKVKALMKKKDDRNSNSVLKHRDVRSMRNTGLQKRVTPSNYDDEEDVKE
jgi:hypothetical protein